MTSDSHLTPEHSSQSISIRKESKLSQIFQNQQKFSLNLTNQIERTHFAVNNLIKIIAQISTNVENQIHAIDEVSTGIEDYSKSLDMIFKRTQQSEKLYQKTVQSAEEGSKATQNSVHAIENIEVSVQAVREMVQILRDNITEITQITNVIQDIANTSKILSVNASIEAARAGDAGRGFGVVADEVGKLAENTTHAVANINAITSKITHSLENTENAMNQSKTKVNSGIEIVQDTANVFRTIIQSINETSNFTQKIHQTIEHQKDIFQNVIDSTLNMQEISEKVLFLTEFAGMETSNSRTSLKMLSNSTSDLKFLLHHLESFVKTDNFMEKTIYTCMQNPLKSLDPQLTYEAEANRILVNIHAGLLIRSASNDVLPGLAKSWFVEEDNRTWVFNLRRGVKFHNGREITAEDIKWSFERLLSPKIKSQNAWFLHPLEGAKEYNENKRRSLDSIRVLGRYRLSLRLEKPDVSFLLNLAQGACAIIAKEDVQRGIYTGCGPYQLLDYDDHIYHLKAFSEYFGGIPYIEHIMVVDNHKEAVSNFLNQKYDFFLLENNEIKEFESEKQAHLIETRNLLMTQFGLFNFRNDSIYTQSKDIRNAINYAINKKRIIQDIWRGYGDLANGIFPPDIISDLSLHPMQYNPSKAKLILKQSNFPINSPHLRILKAEDVGGMKSLRNQMLDYIIEDLAKVNIPTKIIEVPHTEYFTQDAVDKCDLFLMAWLADTGDAENYLRPLFGHDSYSNYGGYTNDEVENLMEEAKQIINPEKRKRMYKQIQKQILSDVPWLLLFHPKQTYVVNKNLRNVNLNPLGTMRFEDIMKIE